MFNRLINKALKQSFILPKWNNKRNRMNFNKFKQIKARIKKNTYYDNWYEIQKGTYIASFAAQLAIIFFGFFYARNIILRANPDINPFLLTLIAAGFLTIIEILKRAITNRWSHEYVEKGPSARIDFISISLVCFSLYVVSFYFSLNGAREFSDRTVQVEEQKQVDVQAIGDSIRNEYYQRIEELEDRKDKLSNDYRQNPTVLAYQNALEQYNERGWRTDLDNLEELQPRYDQITQRVEQERDQLNNRILELTSESDSVSAQRVGQIAERSLQETQDVQTAISEFKYFTIIFEILIIVGVFFHHYFQKKSVTDFEQRLENDPKLNRWYRWDKLLELLYQVKLKKLDQGTRVPKAKELAMMSRLEGNNVPENEIQDFYRFLAQVDILDARGSHKYINQPYDGAKRTLARQFDFEE